jgi:AGCS family alanine or glycine:cation symporter
MKYILKFIIPFTFIFSNLLAQNNMIDVVELITKEFSYKSVKGVDVTIAPSDFIVFQKDGSFSYQVGDIDAAGDWLVQESINSDYVLQLHYSIPKDTIRFFQIYKISNNNLVLIEGDKIFEFSHGFSNKVNVFSNKLNNSFEPIVQAIGSVIFFDLAKIFGSEKNIPFIVVWLVFGAVFFTLKMQFINFKGFKHAISLVKGDYDDPDNKGEVSHFQALTTALSGTVGLGNIAGVAIAISLGGAGATFWMIVAGLLGMSSKFVECTLGVKYRQINSEGVVYGGPMYYLRDGLAKRNLKNLGKFLAILFAVLCVGGSIGGGNMFQANQAFSAIKGIFPTLSNFGPVFGLLFAFLVGFVIIGGIKSIAKVTEKIVPFMAVMYVGASLVIILMHFSDIGFVISEIINGAFTPEAGLGGVIGVLITGFKRAAFSNEAGVGSASIAHSAAKTKEPVSEGMVALLEPFIDTVVICTMTAFVIIITGNYENVDGLGGSELTSQAFGSVISWFPYLLTIAILLFAFSTMISWSYYGLKSWTFLFGTSKTSELSYKILFMIFVVIGSSASLGAVVDFSDMMILAMAFPNIIGLLIMSNEVKLDLNNYFEKIKNGIIKKYK